MFKNSLKEKINSNIIVPKSIEYDIHKSIFFKKKFSYGSVDITKSENSILVEIKLTAYKENYKKYMELEANNEEIKEL